MKLEELQVIIRELAGSNSDNEPPPLLTPLVQKQSLEVSQSLKRELFPDEIETLLQIARTIDEMRDSDIAWQTIRDLNRLKCEKRMTELATVSKAVASNLHLHTVGYYDLKYGESASGILVQILGRIFVATVSHALPRDPVGRICVIGWSESPIQNPAKILSFGREHSGAPDVGFFELTPDYVFQTLKKEPIDLERLAVNETGNPDRSVYLAGYPGTEVQEDETTNSVGKKERLLRYRCVCFMNTILKPEQWDKIQLGEDTVHHPNEDIDLLFPYPMGDGMHLGNNLPVPYGLSGGGVWQGPSKSEIWSPEKYRVIGIQSRWPANGRHLQATQIKHWLILIGRILPDLQHEICGTFPNVAWNQNQN